MTTWGDPVNNRNLQREAHILGFCLEHDIDWQFGSRRGRASYGRKTRGEQPIVRLPEIRGQMTYFVALHELGHILSPDNRYMRTLESEVDAWQWALSNAEEDPTVATLRGIRRRLASYIAKAMRTERMVLPGKGTEFHKFVTWLERAST